MLPTSVEWESFLSRLASKTGILSSSLDVSTFRWKPERPKTAPEVKVTDSESFEVVMQKIRDAKTKDRDITLYMECPSMPNTLEVRI